MEFFMIDAGQLAALKRAATRLHSEDRMSGDEMRDLGHALEAVVRVCKELPIPDEANT
jgi:hypothetical protein